MFTHHLPAYRCRCCCCHGDQVGNLPQKSSLSRLGQRSGGLWDLGCWSGRGDEEAERERTSSDCQFTLVLGPPDLRERTSRRVRFWTDAEESRRKSGLLVAERGCMLEGSRPPVTFHLASVRWRGSSCTSSWRSGLEAGRVRARHRLVCVAVGTRALFFFSEALLSQARQLSIKPASRREENLSKSTRRRT